MAQRKHGKGKAQTIKIEFHVRIKKPPRVNLPAKTVKEMVTWWVETGDDPGGVEILAVTWERGGKLKRAEGGDMETVRENMLKRFLYHMPLHITEHP
jgi:hypothetical protein